MKNVLFVIFTFAALLSLLAAADTKQDNKNAAAGRRQRIDFLWLIRQKRRRHLLDLKTLFQNAYRIPLSIFDCADDDAFLTPVPTPAPSPNPSPTRPTITPVPPPPPTPSTRTPPPTSPTPGTTPAPAPAPTPAPTPRPTPPLVTNSTVRFYGIASAYSVERGKIELSWDDSLLDGNFDVLFDVFVALGDFDFDTLRSGNTSVDDLIAIFNNEPTFEHYQFSDTNTATIQSTYFGSNHTLLVTAKVGDIYSTNSASRSIVVSVTDPVMKEGVNVVGMFVPTLKWMIEMEDAPEGVLHSLNFSGLVSPFAQNLEEGDYITGFTSYLRPFVRCVVAVVQSSPDIVVLTVVHARLEEIFSELDLDVAFEPAASVASASPARFFDDFLSGIVAVGNAIGDAVTGVVEDVKDTLVNVANALTGGEALEEYNLVDIDQEWSYEITGKDNTTGAEVEAKLTARGAASFKVGLFARVRIAGILPIFAEVGAKADFSAEASLEMSAGIGTEYSGDFEIWEGPRMSRVFPVGYVLVEFYAEPKLELQVRAEASLTVSTMMGASANGGTKASAVYDIGNSPVLYPSFEPPYIETSYIPPNLEGELAVKASIDLVLSLEAGLYGGLVAANIGFKAGIGFDAGAGLAIIGSNVAIVPELRRFDLAFTFTIPFSASAIYGNVDIFEVDLYEKSWPILELPSIEIEILQDHRCVLQQLGGGALASLKLRVVEDYPSDAFLQNSVTEASDWYFTEESDGWFIDEERPSEIDLAKTEVTSFSVSPEGIVTVVVQPEIPPLPLKIVKSVSLDSLIVESMGVDCVEAGPCDGSDYFDRLSQEVGVEFNTAIFLSQPPDPELPPIPSTVYKFEDFTTALSKLQSASPDFQFWFGDDCSIESQKVGLVNMAAFLGQSMRETIIFDACDENSWDLWRADIPKEPTSPPEILPALYPMSSGCGQLGQKYAEYRCDDECPQDLNMELTATTNAGWIGAPPPLFCGPKSTYDGLGYWNPHRFCQGADNTCVGEPFSYPGQSAGIHVPISEDDRFPEFFYTNPLPGYDGTTPEPRSPDAFPATNVEGCCWWGRGVIQTTGRCNFGKLNKQVGSGAGENALYPEINFCTNPQAVCTGPSDLKWIAGIAFWVSDTGPQIYDREGYNYRDGVRQFVEMGCAESVANDVDRSECDVLFEYASGIVNRGCHDPGDTGCPACVQGATCDPAHNVPERVVASKQALKALMQTVVS